MSERHSHDTQSELPATLDRQFEIAVRRLADELRFGQDASPYVGSGVDYAQTRPFTNGDPIRDIDWKRTARSGRFHVKEYDSLKSTPIYLLIDTSASMTISSRRFSKYALATLIAGGIALAALRRLSPVGVLAAGDRSLHFEASLSRGRVFQWLHALRHCRFDEQTQLAQSIDRIRAHVKSRSLVILISDLHEPAAVAAVKRLAVKHDCAAIQLQDPAERGRLRAGFIRAREAETNRQFVAHGRASWFDEESSPGQQLQQAGVDHLLLSTDQPFVAPLRRFLATRGGLLRNMR